MSTALTDALITRITGIVPAARPAIGRHAAAQLLHDAGVDIAKPALLGRRGYYGDSMGVPGQNDRGIYDDAIVLVSPTAFVTFNANTDPSAPASGTRLATLAPGLWLYTLGTHHPGTPNAYECLVQAAPVTVHRDNGVTETGEFYIHIHRGGASSTGSEGCQTVPPDQYGAFLELVKLELSRHRVDTIPYLLTDRYARATPNP